MDGHRDEHCYGDAEVGEGGRGRLRAEVSGPFLCASLMIKEHLPGRKRSRQFRARFWSFLEIPNGAEYVWFRLVDCREFGCFFVAVSLPSPAD